ncbi:hypothetical protein MRF4_13545 [Methylobacterium radiotolerans]|uniref:hypothetical protein n=1 Tax=Methylobacterium TaxID=407 RepID=UPI002F33D1F1
MGDPSRGLTAYVSLLVLQTAAACCLVWIDLPIFLRIASNLGTPQRLEPWRLAIIAGSVAVLQCCYWTRLRHVPIHVPFQNILVGHLIIFASRVSFFFGGVFFSVIFFRHLPELDVLPPIGQASAKAFAILTVLFSLFCYALELERLGKAIEGERARADS